MRERTVAGVLRSGVGVLCLLVLAAARRLLKYSGRAGRAPGCLRNGSTQVGRSQ